MAYGELENPQSASAGEISMVGTFRSVHAEVRVFGLADDEDISIEGSEPWCMRCFRP